MTSDAITAIENNARALAPVNALLPAGFHAGLPLDREFPCANMPRDRKVAALVAEAVEAFRERCVLPLWHFPKCPGQRGLLAVEGPHDNLYTIDPSSYAKTDREMLVLWLIISGHMTREKAEAKADQMRAAA